MASADTIDFGDCRWSSALCGYWRDCPHHELGVERLPPEERVSITIETQAQTLYGFISNPL